MMNRDDEKKPKKNPGSSPSGRPATKFMERPKQGESKDASTSADPWAGGEDGSDTDDEGAHPEIPTEGRQGKPGKQKGQPGWEKEEEGDDEKKEDGKSGEDEGAGE